VTPDELSAALSANNVASTAAWRRHGLSEQRQRMLVRQGKLIRIRHGVYATAPAVEWGAKAPGRRQILLVAAARAVTGLDGVASHKSAALIHGLDLLGESEGDEVTITRPVGRRIRGADHSELVVHAAKLPAEHLIKLYGIPVTTVARTVVDVARSSSFQAGVVAADSALYTSKTTTAELDQVLDVCARWPGTEQARRVVAFADKRAESVLESCARVVFAERGLPAPELQVELGDETFAARVDFYWPEYRTVAEADGKLKYAEQGRAVAQLRRDQALRAAAFRVIHFTWFELFFRQDRVIAMIEAAFRGEIG
jgi:predicted transcriptional regulator of viral defense system